ncbi:hypothetical protein [Streptomyces sp. NBC_00236]|uniref:hypothetical protein n=1 Tax=Streptomyces sp. NBC_00236 TaxID=2903639 RepID=UPI002E2BF76B|nr:hypothetical protein [Streptomyces sp. NBC_00236]
MLHDKPHHPGSALSFSGKLLQPKEVVLAVRRQLLVIIDLTHEYPLGHAHSPPAP